MPDKKAAVFFNTARLERKERNSPDTSNEEKPPPEHKAEADAVEAHGMIRSRDLEVGLPTQGQKMWASSCTCKEVTNELQKESSEA